MYLGEKILALIPARGGSKGIKDKNIIDLMGKPLIAYSVESAKGSRYIDDVVLTTDSSRIAEVAARYGAEVPFMRPAALAQDHSKTLDAVLHAIHALRNMGREYDSLVLIQPTQPLRTSQDIDCAIETYYAAGKQALVSVSDVNDHPILIRSIQNDILVPLLPVSSTCRRQDMPPYYRVNGCIYINQISSIDETTSFNDNPVPYIMERSHSVDIDSLSDLALAAFFLSSQDKS